MDELQSNLPFKKEVIIGWKHLDYLKMKITTNGAAKGNPSLAGAGFMLQDTKGRWLACTIHIWGIATFVPPRVAFSMGE